MIAGLCKVGAIAEFTGCDASFIADRFDDYIEDLYPYCLALLEKRREDLKRS